MQGTSRSGGAGRGRRGRTGGGIASCFAKSGRSGHGRRPVSFAFREVRRSRSEPAARGARVIPTVLVARDAWRRAARRPASVVAGVALVGAVGVAARLGGTFAEVLGPAFVGVVALVPLAAAGLLAGRVADGSLALLVTRNARRGDVVAGTFAGLWAWAVAVLAAACLTAGAVAPVAVRPTPGEVLAVLGFGALDLAALVAVAVMLSACTRAWVPAFALVFVVAGALRRPILAQLEGAAGVAARAACEIALPPFTLPFATDVAAGGPIDWPGVLRVAFQAAACVLVAGCALEAGDLAARAPP